MLSGINPTSQGFLQESNLMHSQATPQMHWVCTAFHTNAFTSCAMNALGVCGSSMNLLPTECVPLGARQAKEQFSMFAATSMPRFSEAPHRLLGCTTIWHSEPRRMHERRPVVTSFSAFPHMPCIVEATRRLHSDNTRWR